MYIAKALNVDFPVIPQLCAASLEELKELLCYYEEQIAHRYIRWRIFGPMEHGKMYFDCIV